MQLIDLTGKTALVTGGSRGIGRATSTLLAQVGANVVIGYHDNVEAATALVEELRLAGHHALCIGGDVSRRETFEQIFRTAKEAFGTIDIVVGNAGIWNRAPIDAMTDEQWQRMIDVNLKSIYYTCQFAAREMKPRKSGRIILVSSTAGQRGEAYHSHYAATKGAIIALTKSLAAELGPSNIYVNAVAPGWVDTEMCSEVFSNSEFKQSVIDQIPIRKLATGRDVARTIVFLASELADQVQGEILNVNGGSVLCG